MRKDKLKDKLIVMTIIKKFETEEPNKKLPKKYISLGLFSLFLLILVEIWVNNNAVAYGENYERLSKITKNLSLENQLLENEIARQKALYRLASKSAELGFAEPESIEYIY